jgi:hypothetical protein
VSVHGTTPYCTGNTSKTPGEYSLFPWKAQRDREWVRVLLLYTPLGITTTEQLRILVPLGCGTPCGNESNYYLALLLFSKSWMERE